MFRIIGRLFITLNLLVLSACVTSDAENALAGDMLLAQIQQATPPLVIDTRTRWEYARGHIPGAIHVPFYAKWQAVPDLAEFKDKEVVVYCAHGPRANHALKAMRKAGFSQAQALEGDMSLWRKQGKPIELKINEL